MKKISTRAEMLAWAQKARDAGKTIGFVPTMGALHEGHLSLCRQAKAENNLLVCSIFVNPIQFNKPEDLKHYPRTLEEDLSALEKLGCDLVFCPDEKEMYPEPVSHSYDFGMLDKVMEGRFRPGHFSGVAIVVKRLFELTLPHRAYFGEKDFQQLQVIRALVSMENMPVEVVACPTLREDDGLAMSSRNVRLSPDERKAASLIYQTLQEVREKAGTLSPSELCALAAARIDAHPLLQTEYFEIVSADTLLPAEQFEPGQALVACTAVYAGKIRLIDNVRIID